MAVQAQYPSNVLFLNRGVQEEKNQIGGDYTLKSQPGGGFLDQSHILFTNGVGINPRKRAREIAATSSPTNPFSLQPQPSQAIDLRLAFGEQQQQLQHQQQSLSSQSSVLYSVLSEDLAAQFRQQRDEIEQFLQAQAEQLRRTLAEKRQRHYRALLGAAEESVTRKLREKETEVEKAARRNAELEARAAQISAEAQAWQARARAGEAAAATLQAQLQQAMMGGGCGFQQPQAEEMCGGDAAEDAESAYVDPDRVVVMAASSGPTCKACRKRVASVVILPCRHLSLCTDCNCSGSGQACPICFTFKESGVEVFI